MKEEKFGVMTFIFPSHHHTRWRPVLLKAAEHVPAGGSELIPSFALLVSMTFAFLIKLSLYLNAWVLSFLPFQFSPQSHWWESGQGVVWDLVAGWG